MDYDRTVKEEQERIRKANEERNAQIGANQAALNAQLQSNYDAMARSQAQQEVDMASAQQRQQQDFADIALQYKKDYDAAIAEDTARYNDDVNRARFAGLTEAVASLNNLIGVGGLNASNQQYKQYSMDWMNKADAEQRYRRGRADQLRDRQRMLNQQLAQLRGNQAQQLLALRGQNANSRYTAGNQIAQTQAAGADKLAAQRAQDAAQSANLAINLAGQDRNFKAQEAARADAAAARQAQLDETKRYHDAGLQAQMARYGYTPDGKGGWTKSSGSRSGSGSGSSSMIDITFGNTGKNGEDETISLKSESLITTIAANMDDFQGLDDKDKAAVGRILRTAGSKDSKTVAQNLIPYVRKSNRMMDLVRQTAGLEQQGDWESGLDTTGTETAEATGTWEDEFTDVAPASSAAVGDAGATTVAAEDNAEVAATNAINDIKPEDSTEHVRQWQARNISGARDIAGARNVNSSSYMPENVTGEEFKDAVKRSDTKFQDFLAKSAEEYQKKYKK